MANNIGWGKAHENNSISFGGDVSCGSTSFDTDYQAVLDYATTQGYTLPSAGQQTLQNQLVLDLKAAGVWIKLDSFAVFATDSNSDFALIDWIRLAQLLAVSSPTFTTNGVETDGISSYINTNFNPTNDGLNYTLDSSSFGYYVTNAISTDTSTVIAGARNGTVNRLYELSEDRAFINSTTPDSLLAANSSSGFRHLNRSSSSVRSRYVNGAASTSSNASTAMPNANVYLGCLSIDDVASVFEPNTFAVSFIGGDLSSEQADFNTAIQTYMTAL